MLNWILRKLPNTKQVLIPYTLHPLLHHSVTCPTMSNSTKTRDIRIFAHMMVSWFGPSLTTKVKLLKLSSKSSFYWWVRGDIIFDPVQNFEKVVTWHKCITVLIHFEILIHPSFDLDCSNFRFWSSSDDLKVDHKWVFEQFEITWSLFSRRN